MSLKVYIVLRKSFHFVRVRSGTFKGSHKSFWRVVCKLSLAPAETMNMGRSQKRRSNTPTFAISSSKRKVTFVRFLLIEVIAPYFLAPMNLKTFCRYVLSILFGEMKSRTVFQIDEMSISHVRRNDCLPTVPNSPPDVTDMSVTNSRRSKPSSVFLSS